jgi:hypothetical protein
MASALGASAAASAATPDPKSAAACKYIKEAITGLTTLDTAVCTGAGAAPIPTPPVPPATLTKKGIEDWLKAKDVFVGNEYLQDVTVSDVDAVGAFTITNNADTTKVFKGAASMVLDDEKDNIAVALSGTPAKKMVLKGGRRGKRSARRNRGRKSSKSSRSSKGGRGNRSRRGGKKSRRGRTNKRRNGGAKMGPRMGKELQAWAKRQEKATGKPPITNVTIDKTKTRPQATGSKQRSDSGKYNAAQNRGF